MTSSILQSIGTVETISALRGTLDAIAQQSQQFEREGKWQSVTECEQWLLQTHQLIATLREGES